jgi:indole-3-acetate monooxygenase
VVDGGYRVTGTWHFASGCQHATVLIGGSLVYENCQPRLLPNGQPETRVMLVPASAATIIDTWQTTGMRGTESHDFRVDNVFVPFEDSPNMAEPPQCPGPLYLFLPLFLVSHAGVPLGIARGALDFIEELRGYKEMLPSRRLLREDSQVQETLAWAEASVSAARSYVYSTLEDLWATLSRGDTLSPHQLPTIG